MVAGDIVVGSIQTVDDSLLAQLVMHDLAHLAVVPAGHSSLVDVVVLLKELLQVLIRVCVVFWQTKDLESLLLGHKPAFDSQSFLSDLFSAFVGKFFGVGLDSLLEDELHDLVLSLLK